MIYIIYVRSWFGQQIRKEPLLFLGYIFFMISLSNHNMIRKDQMMMVQECLIETIDWKYGKVPEIRIFDNLPL